MPSGDRSHRGFDAGMRLGNTLAVCEETGRTMKREQFLEAIGVGSVALALPGNVADRNPDIVEKLSGMVFGLAKAAAGPR